MVDTSTGFTAHHNAWAFSPDLLVCVTMVEVDIAFCFWMDAGLQPVSLVSTAL